MCVYLFGDPYLVTAKSTKMQSTNSTNQQSRRSGQNSPRPFWSFDFRFWLYPVTIYWAIMRPDVYVNAGLNFPKDKLHPFSLFMFTAVGFCVFATHYPLLSEPSLHADLSKFNRIIDIVCDMDVRKSLRVHANKIIPLCIVVSLILAALARWKSDTFLRNASLTCCMLSVFLFLVALKYLIGSAVLTILHRSRIVQPLVGGRFSTFLYIDLFLCSLIGLAVVGYPYFLFKERQKNNEPYPGLVFVACVLIFSVLLGWSYYLKNSNGVAKEGKKNNDSLAIRSAYADSLKVVAKDSIMAPSNEALIITSGNINPAILIHGHWQQRPREYWLRTKFQVKNLTSDSVYLPFTGLVKVYPRFKRLALQNRNFGDGRIEYPFRILNRRKGDLIIGPKDSMFIELRYDVTRRNYKYLAYEHKHALIDSHRVFVEMSMYHNGVGFKVNKDLGLNMSFTEID